MLRGMSLQDYKLATIFSHLEQKRMFFITNCAFSVGGHPDAEGVTFTALPSSVHQHPGGSCMRENCPGGNRVVEVGRMGIVPLISPLI